MRYIIFVALAGTIFASGCGSIPLEAIATGQRVYGWKVARQQDFGPGRGTIIQRIPVDEDRWSWKHASEIQFLEGETRSPGAFMRLLEERMRKRCGDGTRWVVLSQDSTSVTYEWSIRSCPEQEDQSEIARLLRGNDGLHRITYIEKQVPMNGKNREFWLSIIGKAYVTKGNPDKPIEVGSPN